MSAALRAAHDVDFHGWRALRLEQGPLRLHVVPSVGGRLMGLEFEGRELAFINPDLEGRTWTPDEESTDPAAWKALCGAWAFPLWGGAKTWIAPESDWPNGVPHRDLDSGPWAVVDRWIDDDSMGVELESPVCRDSRLQLRRRLTLLRDAPRWRIDHRITNRGAEARHCGLWDVLMLARPATVRAPLVASRPWREQVRALPGKPSIEELLEAKVLGLSEADRIDIECDRALEFKCGLDSEEGSMTASLAVGEMNIELERRSQVVAGAAYAHGHPLEVFNAPSLEYFEIESHSPCRVLQPGESMAHSIEDSIRQPRS